MWGEPGNEAKLLEYKKALLGWDPTMLSLGMRLGVLHKVLPWLPAVPGAGYPSYQIHQYSNSLKQRREKGVFTADTL